MEPTPQRLLVQDGLCWRAAQVAPDSLNEELREVELVWTTGAAVVRRPWFDEPYVEELGLEDGQVRLERLNGGAPLLDSHRSASLDDQVGVVVEASLKGGKRSRVGRARVRFAQGDARADSIWNKVRQGIVRNVSVGYLVHAFEEIASTADSLRRLLAVDWEPLELSLVPIGADAGAGVRADTDNHVHAVRVQLLPQETRQMEPNELEPGAQPRATQTPATDGARAPESAPRQPAAPAAPAAPPSDQLAVAEERARLAERERAHAIRTAVRTVSLPDSLADELIAEGVSADAARQRVLERLADGSSTSRTNPHVQVVADDRQRLRGAIESAIGYRMGVASANLPQGASRELHDRPVLRLMEELLEARGVNARGLTQEQLIERSFMSTSDFPILLESSAQRMLAQGYEAAPRTFLPWSRREDFRDFRPETSVTLSGMTLLEELPEGGQIKQARIGENGETGVVRTYARSLSFTREMAYNDDLGAFRRVLQMAGAAAPRVESNLVYALLEANPTMADGVALFHANHGNLIGGAGAGVMGETGINTAIVAMLNQKGLPSATGLAAEAGDAGVELNLEPRHLRVAPAQLQAARKATTATTPGSSAEVNPWADQFRTVQAEARLTANAPAWYYFADPNEGVSTLRWGYLRGTNGGVMIKVHDVQGRLGVIYDVVHDFGAYFEDFRGCGKSTGV